MTENFIKMELSEIQTPDNPFESRVVVLAESEGDREFPIFIGSYEAKALEEAVLSEQHPHEGMRRPMTHDLVLNMLDGLEGELQRMLVTRLEKSTFIGSLEVRRPGGAVVRIDTRPSDGLVLAMKRHVPIFVEEQVLRAVQRDNESDTDSEF
jgi:uncharacterized protein